MEFGRVSEQELEKIDFLLPKDTPLTTRILSQGKGNTRFHIGCAKWSRKDWVGKIYPLKTKPSDYLENYAKSFSCIELNALYHKLPSIDEILLWKSKVGNGFKFLPKFTKEITHTRKLKNVKSQLSEFFNIIYVLEENLGPVFLVLEPDISPKQLDTVIEFIELLPKEIQLFVEIRNSEWFEKKTDPLFELLAEKNVGSIITDSAGRRDTVHMNLSTPQCFIRFVGNSLHPSDYLRIDDWITRIHEWMNQGIEDVYFFMHQHDELYSPELIKYLIEELNRRLRLNIQVPIFYSDKKKDEWTLF